MTTEAERIHGVALHSLIDNLHLQVGIIGAYADKPAGQYARWIEEGSTIGIAAVVDLDYLARAVIEALSSTGTMPAQAVSAPLEPVDDIADPFPPPAPDEPAEQPVDDSAILCRHCGMLISRQMPPGTSWRHVASMYLSCDPAAEHPTMAEP